MFAGRQDRSVLSDLYFCHTLYPGKSNTDIMLDIYACNEFIGEFNFCMKDWC